MKTLRTSLFKHRTTGIYQLRYKFAGDAAFSQMSLKTRNKSEANKKRDEFIASSSVSQDSTIAALEAQIASLKARQSSSGISIDSAWGLFLSSTRTASVAYDTLCGYEAHWKSFVTFARQERISSLELVTHEVASEFVTHMEGSVSRNTATKRISFLRRLWKAVMPMTENPWQNQVAQGTSRRLKKLPFKLDQERKLINESSGEWRLLYAVLAYTGLRLVDACLLSVGDVDFDRHVIELYPRKTKNRGDDPMQAKIGMHPALEMELRKVHNASCVNGFFLPEISEMYQRDKSSVSKRVQRDISCHLKLVTVQRSGEGRGVAVYGAHSFRKALSDRMREAGVDPMVRLKILGDKHSGDELQTYSWISDAETISAINLAMPDMLCKGSVIQMEEVA